MMQFAGEELFAQNPDVLWTRLTDLNFMARTIPGLDTVSRSEPGLLECRVRPGFSFLRGTLDISIELADPQPPRAARLHIRAKGIGASIVVETALDLAQIEPAAPLEPAAPAGLPSSALPGATGGLPTSAPSPTPATRLRWTAEVKELGGLLKAVSRGLIEAAAKKLIADAFSAFRRELDASA